MSIQTSNYLKTRFETGDTPSAQDFSDFIDSTINTGNLLAKGLVNGQVPVWHAASTSWTIGTAGGATGPQGPQGPTGPGLTSGTSGTRGTSGSAGTIVVV